MIIVIIIITIIVLIIIAIVLLLLLLLLLFIRFSLVGPAIGAAGGIAPRSEGGMIRLETLIELKFLNSSFSSLSSY